MPLLPSSTGAEAPDVAATQAAEIASLSQTLFLKGGLVHLESIRELKPGDGLGSPMTIAGHDLSWEGMADAGLDDKILVIDVFRRSIESGADIVTGEAG